MNCSSTFHKGPCESYYDKLGEIRAVLEQVVMDEKDKVVENEVEGTANFSSSRTLQTGIKEQILFRLKSPPPKFFFNSPVNFNIVNIRLWCGQSVGSSVAAADQLGGHRRNMGERCWWLRPWYWSRE